MRINKKKIIFYFLVTMGSDSRLFYTYDEE